MNAFFLLIFCSFVMVFSQESPETQEGQGSDAPIVEPEISVPPLVSDIIEKYIYRAEDKNDPFRPYIAPETVSYSQKKMQGPFLPLQRYDLDQLRLVGVIWGSSKPMAMISDAKNKIYYVKENDKIGNNGGYVAKIREGEIVVIEAILDEYGNREYITKVMQIETKR